MHPCYSIVFSISFSTAGTVVLFANFSWFFKNPVPQIPLRYGMPAAINLSLQTHLFNSVSQGTI
jgi:hypothetical protein